MDEPDYITEPPAAIDKEIAAFEEKARDARAEADHARGVAGLEGPARAAEAEAERLEAEITSLREVRVCIERGFPRWERFGFETAIDAAGEAWHWQRLADVLTPTLALGEETDARMPLDVQRAYARAIESGLFNRFEICSTFEVEGDDVVGTMYYLFGALGSAENPDPLFFVAHWQTAEPA